MSDATVYLPRNVVNAPDIKARIQRRSEARSDTPEVAAWLINHFYRYVVGNFVAPSPAVQGLRSMAELQQVVRGAPPEWAAGLLARHAVSHKDAATGDAPLWWIDPGHEALQTLENKMVEFLNTRRGTPLEGKLMRINCPQALERWEQEHQAFEAKTLSGWREHNPGAVQALWTGSNGSFVELVPSNPALRPEMAYESQMMRHCLGQFANRRHLNGGYGEHYAEACETGKMRIFSYRTGQQQPRITINAWVQADGSLKVDQIKGKQNRPPIDRYRADVIGFLNTLPTADETPNDALGMRMVRIQSGWQAVEALTQEADHLQLLQRQPQLLAHVEQLTPLVQWLAAARDTSSLQGKSLTPGIALALATAGKTVPRKADDGQPRRGF